MIGSFLICCVASRSSDFCLILLIYHEILNKFFWFFVRSEGRTLHNTFLTYNVSQNNSEMIAKCRKWHLRKSNFPNLEGASSQNSVDTCTFDTGNSVLSLHLARNNSPTKQALSFHSPNELQSMKMSYPLAAYANQPPKQCIFFS